MNHVFSKPQFCWLGFVVPDISQIAEMMFSFPYVRALCCLGQPLMQTVNAKKGMVRQAQMKEVLSLNQKLLKSIFIAMICLYMQGYSVDGY